MRQTDAVEKVHIASVQVMEPASQTDRIAALQGKYAGLGPDSTTARKEARRLDAESEERIKPDGDQLGTEESRESLR